MHNNEYHGKILRMLISNYYRGKTTTRQDIKSLLSVSMGELKEIIIQANYYLKNFGLELVGIENNEEATELDAERYFIRKTYCNKEVSKVTEDEKCLFTVFEIIKTHGNRLENKMLETISKSNIFTNMDINEVFKKYKNNGYIRKTNVNDEDIYWSLGWRYHVEFKNSCEIAKHALFKN
ncbi:hypothetical protein ENBRE01_0646 [Enteropsectra breve]|nr:hypothetical protein ENBRE01_0646 [Enteropsectra breve]